MSAKRSVDFLRQLAEQVAKANSFDSVIRKLRITGGGDGKCVAEFKLEQDHVNMRGSIHGGLTATIIDNLSSYALMSKQLQPGGSVDMQIMFMRTAFIGEELIAEANHINNDDKTAYIECEVRSKVDGSLVAKGGQTKYINTGS